MAKRKGKTAGDELEGKGKKTGEMSVESLLTINKAIADPSRFAVLRKISEGSCASSGDLLVGLQIKAATLSHHLKELEAAGLIDTLREGKSVRAALRRKVWKLYVSTLKRTLDG